MLELYKVLLMVINKRDYDKVKGFCRICGGLIPDNCTICANCVVPIVIERKPKERLIELWELHGFNEAWSLRRGIYLAIWVSLHIPTKGSNRIFNPASDFEKVYVYVLYLLDIFYKRALLYNRKWPVFYTQSIIQWRP